MGLAPPGPSPECCFKDDVHAQAMGTHVHAQAMGTCPTQAWPKPTPNLSLNPNPNPTRNPNFKLETGHPNVHQ